MNYHGVRNWRKYKAFSIFGHALPVFSGTMLFCAVLPQSATAHTFLAADARTLDAILQSASPGDRVELADGVYRDLRVSIRLRGTAAQPFVFTASNPGKAVLTDFSRIEIKGSFITVSGLVFRNATEDTVVNFRSADHSRLTDSVFIDSGSRTSASKPIIELSGGAFSNTIERCVFKNILSAGIRIKVPGGDHGNVGNIIEFNHFTDMRRRYKNGQEAIQVGQTRASRPAVARTVVRRNLFENVDSDAEVISNKSSENTYSGNTFRNCRGALTVRGGDRCLVEGNYFVGGSTAIRVFGDDHVIINNYFEKAGRGIRLSAGTGYGDDTAYSAARNAFVANNTFIDNRRDIEIGDEEGKRARFSVRDVMPEDVTVLNNLVVRTKGRTPQLDVERAQVAEGNVVLGPETNEKPAAATAKLADPKILKLHNKDVYRPGSPLAGTVSADNGGRTVDRDIEGRLRSTPLNVGAHEASAESGPLPILTVEDVGPSWLRGDEEARRVIGL